VRLGEGNWGLGHWTRADRKESGETGGGELGTRALDPCRQEGVR